MAPLKALVPLIWGQTEIASGVNGPKGWRMLCRAGPFSHRSRPGWRPLLYGVLALPISTFLGSKKAEETVYLALRHLAYQITSPNQNT